MTLFPVAELVCYDREDLIVKALVVSEKHIADLDSSLSHFGF